MKKLVAIVILGAVVSGVVFWLVSSGLFSIDNKAKGPTNLTAWGVIDEEGLLLPIVEDYQSLRSQVKLTYTKQSLLNYRTRLQTQIRAGQGPDVFLIHSSWIEEMLGELAPAPKEIWSIGDFKQNFYPMAQLAIINNQIYGLPADADNLVMFYNEEIVRGTGMVVPKTWEEFVDTARRTTVRNQQGQIQTAGAALGAADNIDFWPELLALLFFQQPDGNLTAPATSSGSEIMQFYSSFIIDPRNKTWDINLPSARQMFAEGRLAFFFAPSHFSHTIAQANPNLKFKIAQVPQLPGRNVTVGSFWVWAVSSKSKNPESAWQLVDYLTSAHLQQYLNQQREIAGQAIYPYSLVELANLQTDSQISPAVLQAPFAKTWYLNSVVADAGLNEEMVGLYQKAVEGVLAGQEAQNALQAISTEITSLLTEYGL